MGLSVGLAVGQSSIADEISELIKRPKLEAGICYDPEDFSLELQSSVDILVATPGRLMDHINSTKGFTLEHLCYLVSSILRHLQFYCCTANLFNVYIIFLLTEILYEIVIFPQWPQISFLYELPYLHTEVLFFSLDLTEKYLRG